MGSGKRLDLFLIYLSIGFLSGFDIAWTLMKIPRVDMATNTGIFILMGLILALTAGLFRVWGQAGKIPRPALVLFALVFFGLTLYTLASLLSDPKAAWTVAPILIREGLNLRNLSLGTVRWGTFVFLALGFLSSIAFVFGSRARAR